MRRPIHQLGQYHYNPVTGVMEGDRVNLETYQKPDEAPPAPAGTPPITINVNLGEILQGLGLGDLIKALVSKVERGSVTEAKKVPRKKLIESISLGADPREVADLMSWLSEVGGLE